MKRKLLLVTFLLLGIFNGFSQSRKNDQKLSISALPLFNFTEDFLGIYGIVINPSIGYYISEKTSIDLNFSYTTMDDITLGNIDSYYNSYALIPTIRNNFINNEKIRIFAEFGLGIGTVKYNADNNDLRNFQHDQLSGGLYVLNIGIGGNYYFNEKFGLELIIPYIRSNIITSDNNISPYSGIGPTIGFTYKLN
jgi:hypothetical protein